MLKAGLRPVRGRKIVYHRERAFTARLRPPPVVPALGIAELDCKQPDCDPICIANSVGDTGPAEP